MEQYILTIISNRGEEIPTESDLENLIKSELRIPFGLYNSEIYLKKIT